DRQRGDPPHHRHGRDAAAPRRDRRTRGRARRRPQSRPRGHDGHGRGLRVRGRGQHELDPFRGRGRRLRRHSDGGAFRVRGPGPCGEPGRGRARADNFRARPLGPDRRALCRGPARSDRRARDPGIGRHPGRRPPFVRAGRLRLRVAGAYPRGRPLPRPYALRPDPTGDRRERRLGPCARAAGAAHAVLGAPVRRGLRRPRRGVSIARLHPLLVARHDGGARLDRFGARGLRRLAPRLGLGGRLPVRRRDRAAAPRPGGADRRSLAAPLRRPLSGDDPGAGAALGAAAQGRRRAGLARGPVRARSV
ncbi:MAG: Nucleoside ABC transporter, permease protein 2, partial [uncultured Microvirga sp.]